MTFNANSNDDDANLSNTMTNMNKKLNNIKLNFGNLYSYIPNLLNNNIIIPYENLILLEMSINDLSVQLQSIFTIIKEENNIEENAEENNTEENNKLEYITEIEGLEKIEGMEDKENLYKHQNEIVNKTLIKIMPIYFLYLMMIDTESILNSARFGKSNADNLTGNPCFYTSTTENLNNNNVNNNIDIELDLD